MDDEDDFYSNGNTDTPETLDDMRATLQYLKRRIGDCASTGLVDAIEDRVTLMVQALLDERRTTTCACACGNLLHRLEALEQRASKVWATFEATSREVKEDLERLSSKHRDTRTSTNDCIKDIKTLRQDMKDLKHKHKQLTKRDAGGSGAAVDPQNDPAVASNPIPQGMISIVPISNLVSNPINTTDVNFAKPLTDEHTISPELEPGNSEITENLGNQGDDGFYWKDLVRNAYKLPMNVDWSIVRTCTGRHPLLCGRVSSQKWYIGREKMTVSKNRWNVQSAHVPEFLARLKDDCPAIKVGKQKRLFKAVV